MTSQAGVGAIKGAQLATRVRELKREVDATTGAIAKRVTRVHELDVVLALVLAPQTDEQPRYGWFSRLKRPEQTEVQALKADAELNWRVVRRPMQCRADRSGAA